jgi:hypothetical protein
VEADRSQKVDVVSNDTQTVNVEPSERLKMDELHRSKSILYNAPMHMILGPAHRSHNPNRLVLFYLLNLSSF